MAKYSKAAHHISMSMKAPAMDKYDIENAAHHIEKNSEIKANKKLHKAALAHLKKKHAQIGKAIKGK